MVLRASLRLPSFYNPGNNAIRNFGEQSLKHSGQIRPFAISNLESTPTNWHREYTTIQRKKRPSSKRLQGWKPRDQYAIEQAEQRKAANISRQAVLRKERAASMGDPIRGINTPFLESLDTALPPKTQPTVAQVSDKPESGDPFQPQPLPTLTEEKYLLNDYLTEKELEQALDYSKDLTEPLVDPDRATVDTTAEAQALREHASLDRAAREAVGRIFSLSSVNSKERTRANVRRIIDTFGRHNTDLYLRPKAPSLADLKFPKAKGSVPKRVERAGADTGSSEVQIGILTAKIRVLADQQGGNRKDKANKRNLRLLLHRRQKLLKYMEKKERGSDRWQNMIATLGLTEATWKGEIAVQ